ncbi:hypothetical protein MRX96_058396 [Rhipicephalus microplus]
MEYSMKEDYGEGTQVSSALIENTMPEPPVPTPGRGRRRTTSARGRRTTAKSRDSVESRPVSYMSMDVPNIAAYYRQRWLPHTLKQYEHCCLGDSESVIDMEAEQYISSILPDPSTIFYPTGRTSGHSANAPCSSYSAGDGCEEEPPVMSSPRRPRGRQARSAPVRRRRRMAIDGDECIVSEPQTGRWSSLLPVGMVVRRPSTKLVQLVAQAIHESPHRVLRVTHVYAALQ